MNVEGYEVTEAQIAAGLAAMNKDGFVAKDIETAMLHSGCSAVAAYRGSDRLLQCERRAGRIEFVRGKGWTKTTGTKPTHDDRLTKRERDVLEEMSDGSTYFWCPATCQKLEAKGLIKRRDFDAGGYVITEAGKDAVRCLSN